MRIMTIFCSFCICFLLFLLTTSPLRVSAWTVPEGYGQTTLTPEQTLALYGTSISGVYFDGENTNPVTFDYYNTTMNLYTAYCEDNNISPVPGARMKFQSAQNGAYSQIASNGGQFDSQNPIANHNYLIYRLNATAANLDLEILDNISFQIFLSNSVNILGLSAFYSSVFWSCAYTFDNTAVSYSGDPLSSADAIFYNFFYPHSRLEFFANDSINPDTFSFITESSSYQAPFTFGLTMSPTDYYFPGSSAPDSHAWNSFYWFCGIEYDKSVPDVTSGDSFTWSTTQLYTMQSKDIPQISAVHQAYMGNDTYDFSDSYVYLLVQCPVLYGQFILPETTTATTVTTAPSSSAPVVSVTVDVDVNVDLSPILTNQQTQISNQNIMIDNQETIIADLDEAIDILNDIYQELLNHGDINPDMTPVSSISVDQAVQSQMNAAVDGATFPTTADLNTNGVQGIFGLIDRFRSVMPPALIFAYSFVITGGLISFVIFRRK